MLRFRRLIKEIWNFQGRGVIFVILTLSISVLFHWTKSISRHLFVLLQNTVSSYRFFNLFFKFTFALKGSKSLSQSPKRTYPHILLPWWFHLVYLDKYHIAVRPHLWLHLYPFDKDTVHSLLHRPLLCYQYLHSHTCNIHRCKQASSCRSMNRCSLKTCGSVLATKKTRWRTSAFNEDSIVKLYLQTKDARDIGLVLCRSALWDCFGTIFLLLLETLWF